MISVVIPLYNKKAEVGRALRSVANQTTQPAEVVVVDDGSDDGGDRVAAEFPGVRLLRQQHAGVSAARNTGILASSHELIAFLDADDEWDAGFLEEILSLVQDFPSAGMYCTGYRIVQRSGGIRVPRADTQPPRGILSDFLATKCVTHVSSTVVPKAAVVTSGLFRVGCPLGEDLDMWLRLALRYQVAYTSEVRSTWYHTASNRSSSLLPQFPLPVEMGLNDTLEALELPEAALASATRYIQRAVFRAAVTVLHNGRWPQRYCLLRSSTLKRLPLLQRLAISALALLPQPLPRTLISFKSNLGRLLSACLGII